MITKHDPNFDIPVNQYSKEGLNWNLQSNWKMNENGDQQKIGRSEHIVASRACKFWKRCLEPTNRNLGAVLPQCTRYIPQFSNVCYYPWLPSSAPASTACKIINDLKSRNEKRLKICTW